MPWAATLIPFITKGNQPEWGQLTDHFNNIVSLSVRSLFSDWLSQELDVCTFSDYASWRTTGAKDIMQTWKMAQSIKTSGQKCTRTKRCAVTFMGLCLPS